MNQIFPHRHLTGNILLSISYLIRFQIGRKKVDFLCKVRFSDFPKNWNQRTFKKLWFYWKTTCFSTLHPIHACLPYQKIRFSYKWFFGAFPKETTFVLKKIFGNKDFFAFPQGTLMCVNKRFSETEISFENRHLFPCVPPITHFFVTSLEFDQMNMIEYDMLDFVMIFPIFACLYLYHDRVWQCVDPYMYLSLFQSPAF